MFVLTVDDLKMLISTMGDDDTARINVLHNEGGHLLITNKHLTDSGMYADVLLLKEE